MVLGLTPYTTFSMRLVRVAQNTKTSPYPVALTSVHWKWRPVRNSETDTESGVPVETLFIISTHTVLNVG